MQLLSQSTFRELSESVHEFSVSIYLPTHVAGPEIQQDPIRLKNLLSEAEDKLIQAGMPKQRAELTLAPAVSLLEDENFWRYQSHGLALFLTLETAQIYRLPLSFESLVVVGDRFHVKPLLPLYFDNRYFYILALSQNKVRFFQATRYQISEIFIEGIPNSLDEALKYDDPERQVQYHSGNSGGGQPLYHGQGAGADDENANMRRFLTQIDKGLQNYLNTEDVPLIIASVESVRAIYNNVNTYSHLLDDVIQGNPDVTKPEELRDAAWPKVAALIERSHREALANYQSLQGTGKTSDAVNSIVTAAHRGQVDTLFVLANAHSWGQFDAASGEVK
ncbi:MAG: hypothetical protein AAFW75_23895, partial [Cyanobacteria bacterium J06636_16]